jgi:LemA protein
MSFIYLLLIALAVPAVWLIGSFNRLVTLRNRIREAWADIEVQLKRRHDMIPNLMETVKGYAAQEVKVFQGVTEARGQAIKAQNMADRSRAEGQLSQALGRLLAVVENYPDLHSSQNFLELQRELRDTEDKIAAARRFYNTNVRDFNIAIQSFPVNLAASPLGFHKENLFEIEVASEREAPKVKF